MSKTPLPQNTASAMTTLRLQAKKTAQQKITISTCYDFWSARIISATPIDCILVGDSVAMVMHGHASTVSADLEMMRLHVAAVARGATNKFIIGDLPFCSYRKGLQHAVEAAETLLRAGAHAVKLEGASGNLEIVTHLKDSGIPVMGHLGLTPQSVNALGGCKVQGREQQQAEKILEDTLLLEKAGCFAVVLECIPEKLAAEITRKLTIPTIGIGAGPSTDGQVLVLQDMLGVDPSLKLKFVHQFLDGHTLIKEALEAYHNSVVQHEFPKLLEHTFQ